MDDAGSILLLLTRGPSTYATCPSIHGISEAAVATVPTIYGAAYRTFSAADTQTSPRGVYAHLRPHESVITRIRLYALQTPRQNS